MAQHLGENLRYERDLSREQEIALKNKRAGVLVFQISWIMAFLALAMVNWQLRATSGEWPPAGVQRLDVLLPSVGTVALLLSAFFARRSVLSASHDQPHATANALRLVLLLGALFVGIMAYEWLTVNPVPETTFIQVNGQEVTGPVSQYNAIFRVMTAFHAFHAFAIGVYIVRVLGRARLGAYTSADYWDVEASAKLWYFVVFAWIIFYAVLYLF